MDYSINNPSDGEITKCKFPHSTNYQFVIDYPNTCVPQTCVPSVYPSLFNTSFGLW